MEGWTILHSNNYMYRINNNVKCPDLVIVVFQKNVNAVVIVIVVVMLLQ